MQLFTLETGVRKREFSSVLICYELALSLTHDRLHLHSYSIQNHRHQYGLSRILSALHSLFIAKRIEKFLARLSNLLLHLLV